MLALVLGAVALTACEKDGGDEMGNGDSAGGDADPMDGVDAPACSDVCEVLVECGAPADQCESLCTDGGPSCAMCLEDSQSCGEDCLSLCFEDSNADGSGDDGADDGNEPPTDDGSEPPTDDGSADGGSNDDGGGGSGLPDGASCTTGSECESGFCSAWEITDTSGKCGEPCDTDGDCSLGLCCDGISIDKATQSACVNSC